MNSTGNEGGHTGGVEGADARGQNNHGRRYNGRGGKDRGGNNRGQNSNRNLEDQQTRSQKRRARQIRRNQKRQQYQPRNDNQRWNRGERYQGEGSGNDSSFQKFRDSHATRYRYNAVNNANYASNTLYPPPDNVVDTNLPGLDYIAPIRESQPPEATKENKPRSESSSSSFSAESEDSAVRSLKNEVNKALLAAEITAKDTTLPVPSEVPKDKRMETGQKVCKNDPPVNKVPQKSEAKVKTEQNSKSDKSSTSSSSSDDSSSSSDEDEQVQHDERSSVEDVICLGNLEKCEELIDDEEVSVLNTCVLCDKTDHISFHCQTICKNCNGKYHSLKDCPEPANLSLVFSNFIEFCLKQSCKYNPNADFTVGKSSERLLLGKEFLSANGKQVHEKKKSRSKSGHPKSTRKRNQNLSSSSYSSESDADGTHTHKRKRRSKLPEGQQPTSVTIPFTVPYPPAYNSSFGFGPSGAMNPLLAFSHMMGYNHPIDFRGNLHGKN